MDCCFIGLQVPRPTVGASRLGNLTIVESVPPILVTSDSGKLYLLENMVQIFSRENWHAGHSDHSSSDDCHSNLH